MGILIDRINTDLKVAMLAREKLKTEVLRGLKSTILYQEVALNKRDEGLSDDEIEQLLVKEIKKRDESSELFERGGNSESAEKERQEKTIILTYLPKQLSETDIALVVDEVMASEEFRVSPNLGKVIMAVKTKLGTSADGAVIARQVKAKLL